MSKRRYHIIVDGTQVKKKLLADPVLIEEVSCEIAKLCGMSVLHGPIVIKGEPENPGLTCFTIIDFSHISIHTFTADNEICVDVFSCKEFDYQKVTNFIAEIFQIKPSCMKCGEVNYQ